MDNQKKQSLYFYLDDSGVLHKNSKDNYFVYAGYLFLSREKVQQAKNIYVTNEKQIKNNYPLAKEIKASIVKPKHKKFLSQILKEKEFYKIAIIVDFRKFTSVDILDKASINRFKDYIIKILIKNTVKKLMKLKLISDKLFSILNINIDNQSIKSNGYYELNDLILAELSGTFSTNFNFPILKKDKISLNLWYQDSERNILIRASDFIANTLRHYINEKKFVKITSQNFFICNFVTIVDGEFYIKSLTKT
ncbi:DUF3800 domain-containing protein [[Mycoplasma] collis]|uniref:DUF3800 domain-containing protein n=1 Tax=[Mycoplasma] collis TaxID=2127 RepID=UPI00051B22E2|nr:DUF3800 domain-containing protein [[Mycoplasma] collis]